MAALLVQATMSATSLSILSISLASLWNNFAMESAASMPFHDTVNRPTGVFYGVVKMLHLCNRSIAGVMHQGSQSRARFDRLSEHLHRVENALIRDQGIHSVERNERHGQ